MCMSPDEMTSARVEEVIQEYREFIDNNMYPEYHDRWRATVEHLEHMLKERAENGTYDTAGRYHS